MKCESHSNHQSEWWQWWCPLKCINNAIGWISEHKAANPTTKNILLLLQRLLVLLILFCCWLHLKDLIDLQATNSNIINVINHARWLNNPQHITNNTKWIGDIPAVICGSFSFTWFLAKITVSFTWPAICLNWLQHWELGENKLNGQSSFGFLRASILDCKSFICWFWDLTALANMIICDLLSLSMWSSLEIFMDTCKQPYSANSHGIFSKGQSLNWCSFRADLFTFSSHPFGHSTTNSVQSLCKCFSKSMNRIPPSPHIDGHDTILYKQSTSW